MFDTHRNAKNMPSWEEVVNGKEIAMGKHP